MMIRGHVLLLALLVNAPTIWAALGAQTTAVDPAVLHYLISVPIVGLLAGLVRAAARNAPQHHRRRGGGPPG